MLAKKWYWLSALWMAAAYPAPGADNIVQVLQLSEQQDPRFKAAAATYRAAQEAVPQARANMYLPTLGVAAGAAYNWQDVDLDGSSRVSALAGGNFDYDDRGYNLSVVQPVFHYDRHAQLKQAHSSVRQATLEFDAARQDLMLRVAQRYFGVLSAEDNLAFSRADKKSLFEQLERAREQFEAGLVPNTDVQEAQASYDLSVSDEIRAAKLLDDAREALREVSGTLHEALAPLRVDLPLVTPDPNDAQAWVDTAMQQNLRLGAAEAAVETAMQEIRVQYAGHLPSVDIVGSHGTLVSGGRFGSTDTDSSAIGVQMQLPLYAGGQVQSRVREAAYQHEAAVETLEETRRSVLRSSRDAYAAVITGISRVTALAQAVYSNEVALAATQAGFEAGTRTTVDVVAQQRALLRAQTDNAQARYDYVLAGLELKLAAGSLSPEDIALVGTWLRP